MSAPTKAQTKLLAWMAEGGRLSYSTLTGHIWTGSGRVHPNTFNALVLSRYIVATQEDRATTHYAISTKGRQALEIAILSSRGKE